MFCSILVEMDSGSQVRQHPTFNPFAYVHPLILIGPEVTGISSEIPSGCEVDLAAFFSRHGSRYPDSGAYNGWVDLQKRVQTVPLNITDDKLQFLKTWKPVLSYPERQIAQLSPTGYKELHEMGATWRLRYPDLYEYNTPFTMWSNWYNSSPRVRDSARLFAQGFLGPNATDLGTIYALNASDPASWMNSLGTSDLCKAYADQGGSPYKEEWDAIWIPPIRARLTALAGGFNFTQDDVSSIPYLCGFESQITGRRSPFCDILTESEILQYEYAQDLRYWYGTGLGSDIEKYQMLPVIDMLVRRFADGPNATYTTKNSTFVPPKIMANFANDGQINQMIAALGIFDDEPQLPGNMTLPDRKFKSSRLTSMRGTVAFERLSCAASSSNATYGNDHEPARGSEAYLRVRLNDVVYPVVGCISGPGQSCPLSQYQAIINGKLAEAGSFTKMCNVTDASFASEPRANFFMDNTLSFARVIKP